MNNGWIKLHRSILEWDWYDDIPTKTLFIHLLLTCNHSDKKWHGNLIKTGELVTSLSKLATSTHLTLQQVRTALSKLESTQEVTRYQHSSFTHIKLNNWIHYQDINTIDNTRLTHDQQPLKNVRMKEYKEKNINTKKESFKKRISSTEIVPIKNQNDGSLSIQERIRGKLVSSETIEKVTHDLLTKGIIQKKITKSGNEIT